MFYLGDKQFKKGEKKAMTVKEQLDQTNNETVAIVPHCFDEVINAIRTIKESIEMPDKVFYDINLSIKENTAEIHVAVKNLQNIIGEETLLYVKLP